MIQEYSFLDVADNTGAKECMCVKVLGGTRKRYAGLGDVIIASVKQAIPNAAVKKGDVIDLTSRTRADGSLDWTPPAGRWRSLPRRTVITTFC